MTIEPATPPSAPIDIRTTAASGRGVYARTPLAPGTPLLAAARPAASVLFRAFRRAACAWCFAYDCDRAHRLRAADGAAAFCAEPCRAAWAGAQGPAGVRAWAAVEGWVKRARRGGEVEVGDAQDAHEGEVPGAEEIAREWAEADADARTIVAARAAAEAAPPTQTKAHRRALQRARAARAPPDVLAFFLSFVVTASTTPALASAALLLAPADAPYRTRWALRAQTAAVRVLLAVLPLPLLAHAAPAALRALAARDPCNSFGIWSADDGLDADGGGGGAAEMLGYGVWPAASMFNHSCAPRVMKDFVGREWRFWLSGMENGEGVGTDEELCISYIGARELLVMQRAERQAYLKATWGFDCACARCTAEGSAGRTSMLDANV